MEELILLFLFGLTVVLFIGPLIGVLVHSARLKRLERDLAKLRTSVSALQQSAPPTPPSSKSQPQTADKPLSAVVAKRRTERDGSPTVSTPSVSPSSADTKSTTPPKDVSSHSSTALNETVPGPTPETFSTPSDDVIEDAFIDEEPTVSNELFQELPPKHTKHSSDDADNATELLIVRLMTWAGVITLVLGVGFLYRYANEAGWVTPTSRVVGGLVTGVGGFAAAVWCRRKDYVFFGDCLAAASSGVIKLAIYSATVWYGMCSTGTGFRGFLIGGAALWAYAVFFRSRLAASLATVAALLTPALLPDYVGPSASNTTTFAGYLLIVNLTVVAVTWVRAWRLPSALATLGTGIHLSIWYVNAFSPTRTTEALAWLAAFTVVFLAHVFIAVWKTEEEHALDSPILVGGASFLMVATMGVTRDASFLVHAISPTVLAGVYLALWSALRNRLPGRLPSVLGATAAFLLAAAAPLWLSPAWTLVSWAALAWVWGRLAIRDDRMASGVVAGLLFGSVQILTFWLAITTVLHPNRVPMPVWDWNITGSLLGQLEALFHTVPIDNVSWLGKVFHARSVSLLACGVTALALMREAARAKSLPNLGTAPKTLANTFAMIAAVNLVGVSLCEWTHAAVRGDWQFATTASVWLLHFAAATAATTWWDARRNNNTDSPLGATLLTATMLTAVLMTIMVVFAALKSHEQPLPPVFSLRSLFMLLSSGVLAGVGPMLKEVDSKHVRSIKLWGVIVLALWAVCETIQLGVWLDLSAEEVSALITAVLAVVGAALLTVGFLRQDISCRRGGLATLGLATLKIYLLDVWTTTSEVRTIAFLVLGVLLLAAAFLYRRYRDQFRDWVGDGRDVLR